MNALIKSLEAKGFQFVRYVFVSEKHQEVQYDWGMMFYRDGECFYLNHWTINNLPN